MNKQYANQMLEKAMREFADSYSRLLVTIDTYETETDSSINNLQSFVDKFPFEVSFDELPIETWVNSVIADLHRPKFKVHDYQYLNTGGNCMVGCHNVWLPEEKRMVYVYTNEEGSTISTVDYIRYDLEIDDYDEFIVDCVDWGRITGSEKYFELYRYCYNQYLVDDCKYFGITRGVQYHLLSDKLQEMISDDYLKYLAAECGMMVDTDGEIVVTNLDYEATQDDERLRDIKDWKHWHDNIVADEDRREAMYEEHYQLTLAGKTVRLPFYAETFNLVDDLLKGTIEDW